MKVRATFLVTGILAALLAGPFGAQGGHREGNGGDYLRASFIKMGQAVLQHLRDTPDGQRLAVDHDLDLDALAETLSIDVIKVSDQTLTDNGGSVVDAIGRPGSITLAHDSWAEYLERERDVYFLVFHEMLRAASIRDDNYVISADVRPFPASERVATSIMTQVPLIPEDDLASYIDTTHMAVTGSGCPSGFGALVDLDANRNVLELRVNDFTVSAGAGQSFGERRKNCAVIVPVLLPAGKRLVITQVDAAAELSLPVGASFNLRSEAHFQGLASTLSPSKTVTAADAPVSGRTLLRASGQQFSSSCGADRALIINLSGHVTPGAPGETSGRVVGSSIYLSLQGC